MIELLRERNWNVTFLALHAHADSRYGKRLAQLGVESWAGPDSARFNPDVLSNPEAFVGEGAFNLALLHFWHAAEESLPLLRARAPDARVIVDSVDLHLLRRFRSRFVHAGRLLPADGDEAIRELNVYARADAVLAASAAEAGLIDTLLGMPGHVSAMPDFEGLEAGDPQSGGSDGARIRGQFPTRSQRGGAQWFCAEVVPQLDTDLLHEHPLDIIGTALTSDLSLGVEAPGPACVGSAGCQTLHHTCGAPERPSCRY